MVIGINGEIDLTEDDLYSDGYYVTLDDGTMLLKRDIPLYIKADGDDYQQLTEGQRLDTISFDNYNTSKLWYKIADANLIFNPFVIPAGTGLIIPSIAATQNGL